MKFLVTKDGYLHLKQMLVVILVGLSFVGKAQVDNYNYQPGYIVKMNGDTVRGYIDYRNWVRSPKRILFKKEQSDIGTYLAPGDTKRFGVFDEAFVGAIVKIERNPSKNIMVLDDYAGVVLATDTVFLRVLFDGPRPLYYHQNFVGKEQFYIKNSNDELELLIYKRYLTHQGADEVVKENKTYLGQLIVYLNEYPREKIIKTKYEKESVVSLFQSFYNTMQADRVNVKPVRMKADPNGDTRKVYSETATGRANIFLQSRTDTTRPQNIEKPKPETVQAKPHAQPTVDFGVIAGMTSTSVKFQGGTIEPYLTHTDYQTSTNFAIGLNIDVVFPRNTGWSVYNEVMFGSCRFSGFYSDYYNSNYYTNTNSSLGVSYFKLSNLLRYRFIRRSTTVFANVGISNELAVSSTNTKEQNYAHYGPPGTLYGAATGLISSGFEIAGGLGATVRNYSFEIRYGAGSGMFNSGSSTQRIYFLAGYRFLTGKGRAQ